MQNKYSSNVKGDERIELITNKIVERFNPKRIILFGSRARGDFDADSDYDIFVEAEMTGKKYQRAIEISRLFIDRNFGMDIIVYTPVEVRELRKEKWSFLTIIENEGITLYEQ